MMIFFKKIYFSVDKGGPCLVPVTSDILSLIRESQIEEGLLTAIVPGLGASLLIAPPIEGFAERLLKFIEQIPGRGEHFVNKRKEKFEQFPLIAQTLFGSSISVPFSRDGLSLNRSREIFLADFESLGGRREVAVQILSPDAAAREQGYEENF